MATQIPRVDAWSLEALEPERLHCFWLRLLRGADDAPSGVPVQVLRAQAPGPTVGVVAVIHGEELNGAVAIHALADRALAWGLRRGALVMVPVVNVPGFWRGARNYWDGKDLNRSMEGPELGRPSQRFGWRFVERIVKRLDYLVDLHTATTGYRNSLYARADLDAVEVRRMVRAMRVPIVLHRAAPNGSLRQAALRYDVVAVAVEIGDPGCVQPTRVARTCASIGGLLAELDMIDGALVASELPIEPQVVCRSSRWLRTRGSGLAVGLPEVATRVTAGQTLARVVDVWGGAVDTVVARHPGVVIGAARHPVVMEGTRLIHLGAME
jgi:uncharacterized protein